MFFCICVAAAGNLWYALSTDVYQIIGARFVVGISLGSSAAANAFISYATLPSERSKFMSINGAVAVLGALSGSGLAALGTALLSLSPSPSNVPPSPSTPSGSDRIGEVPSLFGTLLPVLSRSFFQDL